MKRRIVIISFFFVLIGLSSARAAQNENLWREAAEAYQAGDYQTAMETYAALLGRAERPSAPLLYNLGNVHYQLGDVGRAAWFYERTLERKPRMAVARENLEIVRAQTGAPLEPEAFFLWWPFQMLAAWLTPGEWALVLAVCWSGAFILGAFYMVLSAGPARVWMRRLAITFGVACVVVAFFAIPRLQVSRGRDLGVILEPGVVVRA
ncbi:MAG: hypothetical protein ACOC29_03010, partial [Candidatus Sumerlaeota bacterium]